MIHNLIMAFGIVIGIPILIYFCVKFGTIAFYKGKEFIKKEQSEKE